MSYILRFKVDRIKIDRSFISNINCDLNSGAVAHAIIALAHGLNINVIAEGVETSDVCDILLDKGCDEAQGFYYSRGVSMDELLKVVGRIEVCREVRRERALQLWKQYCSGGSETWKPLAKRKRKTLDPSWRYG